VLVPTLRTNDLWFFAIVNNHVIAEKIVMVHRELEFSPYELVYSAKRIIHVKPVGVTFTCPDDFMEIVISPGNMIEKMDIGGMVPE